MDREELLHNLCGCFAPLRLCGEVYFAALEISQHSYIIAKNYRQVVDSLALLMLKKING